MTPDPGASLPGRGAYLHRREECWEAALRRDAFARALRRRVRVTGPPPF